MKMKINERQFPIIANPQMTIPWGLIAPHEQQAQKNHCGQTLERLAARGGLSPCEALAVIGDRAWKKIADEDALQMLNALAFDYYPKL